MRNSFIILFIILFCYPAYSQFLGKKINKLDDAGNRHGYWVEYWDDTEDNISGMGRFKHGKAVGKWKYLHLNQKRRMKFKYYGNRIKVKYYDERGKLEHKGYARLVISEEEIRYFWEGIWKYYNSKHKLIKKALFIDGEEAEILFSEEEDDVIDD